jgi:hypothetical protein
MKIVGIFNPTNTDVEKFLKDVTSDINLLQNDGQEVEIQYHPCSLNNGQVIYTALILGKK